MRSKNPRSKMGRYISSIPVPNMSPEAIRGRMLTEIFRQTNVPKSYCMFCMSFIPEDIHIHTNRLYVEPMTRTAGEHKDSYQMGEEIHKGYRMVVTADTRCSKNEHAHLLFTILDKTVEINLEPKSQNYIEFMKLPETAGKSGNTLSYFELAYKLNAEPPATVKLPNDPTHTRLISTSSSSVLVMSYWKKKSPYPEYDCYAPMLQSTDGQ